VSWLRGEAWERIRGLGLGSITDFGESWKIDSGQEYSAQANQSTQVNMVRKTGARAGNRQRRSSLPIPGTTDHKNTTKNANKAHLVAKKALAKKNSAPQAQDESVAQTPAEEAITRQQQLALNVFKDTFSKVLSSPTFKGTLQSVKQALFDRDFARAFGNKEYLSVYAARYSPTRALCYSSVLTGIRDHLDPISTPRAAEPGQDRPTPPPVLHHVSIGGGAAETVAFGAFLSDTQSDNPLGGTITLVDSAAWGTAVSSLAATLTTAPKPKTGTAPKSEIEPATESTSEPEPAPESETEPAPVSEKEPASESKSEPELELTTESKTEPAPAPEPEAESAPEPTPELETEPTPEPETDIAVEFESDSEPESASAPSSPSAPSAPLIPASLFSANFIQQDAFTLDETTLSLLLGSSPLLISLMFTLNELFTSGGIGKTTRFLLDLTSATPIGSLLLVVDSPGSYSETTLGREAKRYPMQWLLDRIILGTQKEPVGGRQWKKLESHDSVWCRLSETLDYPIRLENMRYQMHLYKAEDATVKN